MKAQRIKITEPGMITYNDWYGGYKFTNGLSDDPVIYADQIRIGSFIRIEAVDDGKQAGAGVQDVNHKSVAANVVVPLAESTPNTIAPESIGDRVNALLSSYTRESLEAIADKEGIAGLRAIGERYGVKGRGIGELIAEILAAQAKE